MNVSLEPVVYILRLHEDGGTFGDPYVGTATVTVDDDHVACLRGMTAADFTRDSWEAIDAALRNIGVKSVLFTRRNRGMPRTVRVKVS